jgi:biotin operon repressor
MEIGQEKLNQWVREKEKGIERKRPYGIKISKTRYKGLNCLSAHEKDIYIGLRLFADQRGYCYPSQRNLATLLGHTQKTIWKNIKKLKEKGWILKIERKKGRGGVRYAYWLKEW